MSEKKAKNAPSTNKFKDILSKIAKYFRGCKGEIKKITWPTPRTVFKNTGIVIAVIVVIGLFIFGLDMGVTALLELVMDVSSAT